MDLGKGGVAYDLQKETGDAVKKVEVALTWPKNAGEGNPFDPDVVAFGVDDSGKVLNGNEAYFVKGFPKTGVHESPDGAIVHSGDDTTGETGEKITIDTTKFAPGLAQADIAATIYKAVTRQQNFGTFGKLKVAVTDLDTGKVIGTGNLSLEHSAHTAAKLLAVIKDGDKVYIQTNIEGFNGGLAGLAGARGVQVGANDYDN